MSQDIVFEIIVPVCLIGATVALYSRRAMSITRKLRRQERTAKQKRTEWCLVIVACVLLLVAFVLMELL